jgi:glycosyltransferase involved in cell wall biosynthesis
MSQKPQISVLIPAYNYGHKIAAAIQSVRNQEMVDIEIVIVNDCSPDDTDEVVASLLDDRTMYLKNERNLGVNMTINRAIRAATADYVCILAADDVLPPASLKLRYNHITTNDYDAVHAGTTVIRDSVTSYVPPLDTRLTDNIIHFLESGSELAGINNATFMYHKRVFERIGYRDETQKYFPHNDYEFALRCLLNCNVGIVNAPAYIYEIHPNSHSDIHATNTAAELRLVNLKHEYIQKFSALES